MTTGETIFCAALTLVGMLFSAVLFSYMVML